MIMSAVSYFGLNEAINRYNEYESLAVESNTIDKIQYYMLKAQLNAKYYIEKTDPKYKKEYNDSRKAMINTLEYFTKTSEQEDIIKIVNEEIGQKFDEYDKAFEKINELNRNKEKIAFNELKNLGQFISSTLNKIAQSLQKEKKYNLVFHIDRMVENNLRGQLFLTLYLYNNNETFLELSYVRLIDDNKTHMDSIEKNLTGEDNIKLFERVKQTKKEYKSFIEQIAKIIREKNLIIENELDYLSEEIIKNTNSVKTKIVEEQNKLRDTLISFNNRIKLIVLFATITSIILSIIIIIIITMRVLRTLGGEPSLLANIANKMSSGQLTIDLEKDGIKKKKGLLGDIMKMVDSLENKNLAIKEIANGNLDVKIDVISDKDEVGKSLNKMVSSIKDKNKNLKEERDKAQNYLDIVEVIMIVLDREGCIKLINKKGCKVLGYKEGDLIGKNFFKTFMRKKEIQPGLKTYKNILEKGRIKEYAENQILTKSGKLRTVAWHNALLYDDKGNITGVLSSGDDVTERRKLEDALNKSEHRLSLAFEAANDGLWDLNIETGEIYFSPRYYTMLGYEPGDFPAVYESWEELLHPDNLDVAVNRLNECIKYKKDIYVSEFRMRTKTNEWKWIFSRGKVVEKNKEGEPLRMVGTHVDITPRKHFEKQLQDLNEHLEDLVVERTSKLNETNKSLTEALKELRDTQDQLIQSEKMSALGGLVAGIAHEINTPLGIGVTGASHLELQAKDVFNKYKNEKLTRRDIEEFFDIIFESSKMIITNLNKASNMIRSFKNIAVDQSSENKRRFNVKEYINELLLSLKPKLKNTKHNITVECDKDFVIKSYPGAFSQIITNLIMNSLIHGFENIEEGEIKLKAKKKNNFLIFTYSDNGKGIDEKHLQKIYEPFFTTKRGIGGSGLGMNIVYNLVTQTLSGSIKCKSEIGEGTTFIMKIPVRR